MTAIASPVKGRRSSAFLSRLVFDRFCPYLRFVAAVGIRFIWMFFRAKRVQLGPPLGGFGVVALAQLGGVPGVQKLEDTVNSDTS